MCDLISGVGLALGGAKTLGDFLSGGASASANRASASADYLINGLQIAERMRQERKAAAEKGWQMQQQYEQVVSAGQNKASEMGVSGNTIQGLMDSLAGQEANRQRIVKENSDNVANQLAMQSMSEATKLQSRFNANRAPSLSSLALGLAGDAMGSLRDYSKRSGTSIKDIFTSLLGNGEDE